MEINYIMANDRKHFYYSLCERLAINKPLDCRQHITQKTQNINGPCYADSHFPYLLHYFHLTLQHFYPAATLCTDFELELCANFAYKSTAQSGQLRHNKTRRCPSVRLCIFFSLCSLHHSISLCFQGAAHPLQNLCMSSVRCKVSTGTCECIIVMHGEQANQECCLFEERSECAVFKSPLLIEDVRAPLTINKQLYPARAIQLFTFPTMCNRWLI